MSTDHSIFSAQTVLFLWILCGHYVSWSNVHPEVRVSVECHDSLWQEVVTLHLNSIPPNVLVCSGQGKVSLHPLKRRLNLNVGTFLGSVKRANEPHNGTMGFKIILRARKIYFSILIC